MQVQPRANLSTTKFPPTLWSALIQLKHVLARRIWVTVTQQPYVEAFSQSVNCTRCIRSSGTGSSVPCDVIGQGYSVARGGVCSVGGGGGDRFRKMLKFSVRGDRSSSNKLTLASSNQRIVSPLPRRGHPAGRARLLHSTRKQTPTTTTTSTIVW